MRSSIRCVLGSVIFAACMAPGAHGQVQWSRISGVGYAAAGAAIGVIPAMDISLDGPFWLPPVAGLVIGAAFGHWVGAAAERKVADGEELSAWHRNTVRLGTVLVGASVGAVASAFLINSDGPSSVGSDEMILSGGVLGGAALGALIQLALEPGLHARAPDVNIGVSRDGAAAFILRYPLPHGGSARR